MKQGFAIALMLVMLFSFTASAECGCGECADCACRAGAAMGGVLIARSDTVTVLGSYTGAAWWALSGNQLVIGLKAPDEQTAMLNMQAVKAYIRGNVDTGLIREKGTLRVVYGEDDAVYGLTRTEVKIRIKEEYIGLVQTIVHDRLGADVAMDAGSIIASTQWWREGAVAHIFFTAASARVAVGTVTVNGGMDTIILYAGDFNGDGGMELGFAAGWTVPEPPKAPETPCKPCQPCNKKPCAKGGCSINIQINILSIVKNIFTKVCQ